MGKKVGTRIVREGAGRAGGFWGKIRRIFLEFVQDEEGVSGGTSFWGHEFVESFPPGLPGGRERRRGAQASLPKLSVSGTIATLPQHITQHDGIPMCQQCKQCIILISRSMLTF